jgi:hypothetical protein
MPGKIGLSDNLVKLKAARMHSKGSTILFSEMTPQPAWAGEFNDWYDTEHIPLRMACPGFVSAQRYRASASASYLAVYEMGEAGDLKTPQYSQVKGEPSALTRRMLGGVAGFTRYIGNEIEWRSRPDLVGDPLDAPVLFAVFFEVPAARHPAFDAWYANEQMPLLLDDPDWWLIRRFALLDGDPGSWTHLTLHYLADRRALESSARARARSAGGRQRFAQEAWFRPEYLVFNRLGARQQGLAPRGSAR